MRPRPVPRPAAPRVEAGYVLVEGEAEELRAARVLVAVRRIWGPPRPPPGEAEGRMAGILERARVRAQEACR